MLGKKEQKDGKQTPHYSVVPPILPFHSGGTLGQKEGTRWDLQYARRKEV
jgi:hypothetical protein